MAAIQRRRGEAVKFDKIRIAFQQRAIRIPLEEFPARNFQAVDPAIDTR